MEQGKHRGQEQGARLETLGEARGQLAASVSSDQHRTSPGNTAEMHIIRLHPDLQNQALWGRAQQALQGNPMHLKVEKLRLFLKLFCVPACVLLA